MKKIYTRIFILTLAVCVFAADGFGQKPVLFVGRDALGDYQSDQDLYDSLTAWGYAPEFWNSNGEYDVGTDADFNELDYNNYEAMFIAESVDSKAMARFAQDEGGYPLPCVNLEGYCVATGNDRWAWLNDNGAELLQSSGGTEDDLVVIIKDNSHYITQDYNVGDEVPWSALTEASDIAANGPVSIKEVNVDYDGKLAQMKSHAGEADFWNLVTVDDIDGSGNKIVFWGLNHIALNGEAQDGSYGTPEFFTLIKRACAWAYDDAGANAVEQITTDRINLVAFPNPASERVTIRYKADVRVHATGTLYNLAGQQIDIFHQMTKEGKNFMYLDADRYPAGIYQLRLDVDGETAVTKVVIQ
ncbi:MAG TPA: T9SS type A sorting domain-containing protein [Bacteroides sp.]|nr:T9SS type A sorting domain-containing protein [Bacteroides sp.]